ncbi:uncharacterized protein LOC103357229 isoform X2 [Stegastes partitus]|uniref:Uncharacterized protein LOC103357229 isoform X2 n=1 Tax=Stegastes partitus TaxID=144197 RepID=A0A9Y4JS98_9TELE|nr:PREDICTED: uncharacterized protein LOC103357229 isoform X2 [Stegastes partitus]
MSKTCPELLREAANLIEEALRRTSPAAPSQQIPVTPQHTPVQAQVARLFAPYDGGGSGSRRRMMRRSAAQSHVIPRSYRHAFCCLADHQADKVPSIQLKADLLASRLVDQRVTFSGDAAVGQGVTRYFLTTIISKLQFGFSLDLGGTGRTLLFEGEPDHLVPAASEVHIESNLFRVAGRMMGHSFLHDGPCVTGLSPAVIHALFNGDPEMATIAAEDCRDLHIRNIIKMLELEELSQEQKDTVSELSMSWDLPAVMKTNQRSLGGPCAKLNS